MASNEWRYELCRPFPALPTGVHSVKYRCSIQITGSNQIPTSYSHPTYSRSCASCHWLIHIRLARRCIILDEMRSLLKALVKIDDWERAVELQNFYSEAISFVISLIPEVWSAEVVNSSLQVMWYGLRYILWSLKSCPWISTSWTNSYNHKNTLSQTGSANNSGNFTGALQIWLCFNFQKSNTVETLPR